MHASLLLAVIYLAVTAADVRSKELPRMAIWDGHADFVIVVRVTDASSHAPVRDAVVTLIRSQDAEIVPENPPLPAPTPVRTDTRGFATFKARFDAEGDRRYTVLLVGQSRLRVDAPGYRQRKVWVSPTQVPVLRSEPGRVAIGKVRKLPFWATTRELKKLYEVALHRS